jgi:hypothetical protein
VASQAQDFYYLQPWCHLMIVSCMKHSNETAAGGRTLQKSVSNQARDGETEKTGGKECFYKQDTHDTEQTRVAVLLYACVRGVPSSNDGRLPAFLSKFPVVSLSLSRQMSGCYMIIFSFHSTLGYINKYTLSVLSVGWAYIWSWICMARADRH